MKYEVTHGLLTSTQPEDGKDVTRTKSTQFRRGDVVTEAQLKDAGFDLDHLKANGAVEELKGSESDEDKAARRAAPPTTTGDATPHMATAPQGTPETAEQIRQAQKQADKLAAAGEDDRKGSAKK